MPARRSTEHRFRKLSRLALSNVPKNQANRAANCGVWPVTGTTEGSLGMVKSKLPDHRSANNGERRTAERAALGTQDVEGWVEHRLQGGQHNRYIFRLAAGHRTVDGNLLNGRDSFARRDDTEHLVGLTLHIIDDLRHLLRRWRKHRHAVG